MLQILALPPILFCLMMFSGIADKFYSNKASKPKFVFSPDSALFSEYLAGKNFPRNRLGVRKFDFTDIFHAGKLRYGISLGGRFKLIRYATEESNPKGLQWNFSAGMNQQTDLEEGLDVIGWDGIMRSETTFTITDKLTFKFGVFHISGHIGDEYLEKVKRKRKSYARNEIILALSYNPIMKLRSFLEAGYDYSTNRAAPDDPYRFQLGFEYFGDDYFKVKKPSYYFATNFESYQEDRWKVNQTYQFGLITRSNNWGRIYRLYFEYYTGKSQMTEFYNHREKHYSVEIAFDL